LEPHLGKTASASIAETTGRPRPVVARCPRTPCFVVLVAGYWFVVIFIS
jgi:hypothetical protein